ncbi:hypothetical protein K432DRAFT_386624 [Lepidopterella palustris CBS 459.81]|uniref:J domain-containing protein n=1 Tax=Lepidopterella palustris CBS 459.81 TaxID=1314670 RepID=A0A8E2JAF4_9PEZI|nr:hypothetical protein K432DRAFT_386624 [Lepidopterella palustris CBS 459.81]
MLSKKPAIFIPSYTSLSTFYNPPQSHASCRLPTRQSRTYATPISPSLPHHEEADLSWPDPIHPHKTPTPYQILSLAKNEPYTKQRFYSLVKLYHPDRAHPASPASSLPPHVRLERYRLLVAAHTILSDPAKRTAYDIHGAGWSGHPGEYSAGAAYERRKWPAGQDPMYNATWEDWERWYSRDKSSGPQTPVYFSNAAFISLIFALAAIGGVGQATRANTFSSTALEYADKVHMEASRELMRARHATRMTMDRDERIESFLRHREAVLSGEEAYQRLLPEPERCAPEDVRRR